MSSQAIASMTRQPLRQVNRPAAAVVTAIVTLMCLALPIAAVPLRWTIGGLAGAVLALLVVIRPAIGLAAVALLIPFGELLQLPGFPLNAVDVLVVLVVVGWLARGVAERRIVLHRPALIWPLLIFLWCAALSLTQAISWREGLPEWLKWAEFAALYLVATQVLSGRAAIWTLTGLLVAGTLQAALGAYQFNQQVGPEAFILPGGFMRAHGTFRQPNPYAGYLGYLFPVVASLGLSALGQWKANRRGIHLTLFAACAAVTGMLGLGILLSWSRGAWLGLIAGGVAVMALRGRRSAAFAGSIVIVLIVVMTLVGTGWMPQTVSARIRDLATYVSGSDPSRAEINDANFAVLERLAHWRAGQRMFDDHPWLGVGIGNYGTAYPAYALPHWYLPLGHAHNVFINFLAEIGAIGFVAFMLFWLGVAWLAWRSAASTSGYARALGIGMLGMWVYLNVHGIFDNLFVQHMQLQLALLLGILVTIGDTRQTESRPPLAWNT